MCVEVEGAALLPAFPVLVARVGRFDHISSTWVAGQDQDDKGSLRNAIQIRDLQGLGDAAGIPSCI